MSALQNNRINNQYARIGRQSHARELGITTSFPEHDNHFCSHKPVLNQPKNLDAVCEHPFLESSRECGQAR